MGRRNYSAMINDVPLHKTLVEAVRSCGLTPTELAKEAGVNRNHLHDLLAGRTQGSTLLWQRLLDAGDVEIGWRHKA